MFPRAPSSPHRRAHWWLPPTCFRHRPFWQPRAPLLSLQAVDRLDPLRRHSPPDRELLAQGAANLTSGLLGGLPVTAVIVRSGANVAAGGRERLSSLVHGILLLVSVVAFGPLLNQMHKYVVSTTLTDAPWKESTIISTNVVEEIAKLKQQPGKDIIIDGSASLVQSLMGTGLIDEYRFLVQPFVMGRGRRFFPDGTPPSEMKLVESKLLSFGSLALVFQPADK